MNHKIFIVLPVFNRINFTKKCLSSIYSQTYKNFQLILIDDGSTDGTSEYVLRKYPKTKIIYGDGNWWWTKSMYEGAKEALKKASLEDYILEMNNDLYFDKDYLKKLLKVALKNKNSLVGSICVRNDNQNEVVESGIKIDWATGLVYGIAQTVSNKIGYYKNIEVVDNLDALPGKGTLVPIPIFKKGINFKYKELPHYLSDYEFSANAKKHGYKLIVATHAVTKHYWEATGISIKNPNQLISYKMAWQILFGRKSMNNIIDWVKFINMHCPKEYKLRNYYYASLKIFKAILLVRPFNLLNYPIKYLAIAYHAYKYPDMAKKRLRELLKGNI